VESKHNNPQLIKTMVQKHLLLLNGLFLLTYLVLDGHFGNNNALQMGISAELLSSGGQTSSVDALGVDSEL